MFGFISRKFRKNLASLSRQFTTDRGFEFHKKRVSFHPHEQRSAFRHRDVRQQSRIVRPLESIAET
jgi:hypothetical protein